MKKWKYILISSILIFLLNFPAHFLWEWIPNDFIGIFFPTNESIFQHMKMIFTCFFLFYFILFIVRKRFSLENIFFTNLISSISCIVIFLVIYIPTYFRCGEHMAFTLILLFFSILIGQITSYSHLKKEKNKNLEIISLLLIFILFGIGGYLTYHPINHYFFWDPEHETYESN